MRNEKVSRMRVVQAVVFSIAAINLQLGAVSAFSLPAQVSRSGSVSACTTTTTTTPRFATVARPRGLFDADTAYPSDRDQNDRAKKAAANNKHSNAANGSNSPHYRAQALQKECYNALHKHEYGAAFEALRRIRDLLSQSEVGVSDRSYRDSVSEILDRSVQQFTTVAFESRGGRLEDNQHAIQLGINAMELQLQASGISQPYHLLPKHTYVTALQALTQKRQFLCPDWPQLAYRILQRLVSGAGVRHRKQYAIYEKTFCSVLQAYVSSGAMDMAQQVIELQQRAANAPPLSAVSYSILIKGYGSKGDLESVEKMWKRVQREGVKLDIIFYNTLLDAYINCGAMDKAQTLFSQLCSEQSESARPNRRTYNTILKGLANAGNVDEALELSQRMQRGLWDAVTTNTLVHAAVVANDLDMALELLKEHTVDAESESSHSHPNVEAYTEVLDAYAKVGQLDQVWSIWKMMRDRSVAPNCYSYTCLIAGLARHGQVKKARQMLQYMSEVGLRPSIVTYNALLSALLHHDHVIEGGRLFDQRIDESLMILEEIQNAGLQPNSITLSVLIQAMSACPAPRMQEAKELMSRFQGRGSILQNDAKVTTSLIQICGRGGDLAGAIGYFRSLKQPDLFAVNALLDACCRCHRTDMAIELFNYYLRKKSTKYNLTPDIVSYSVLIVDLLKDSNDDNCAKACMLYKEMTKRHGLRADKMMIDLLLKAVLRKGRSERLSREYIMFMADVLRDAERLPWAEGQLVRRQSAVKALLSYQMHQNNSYNQAESEDELFTRKGWNKFDSSFRVLGTGEVRLGKLSDKSSDKLLRSKGWNDFDSGFRII
jgi:pentatricopeptide repeat protein